MPEGVGYGPQYTASTGLELNIIGDFCYAYSGAIQTTTSLATVLDFTTPGAVIDGTFYLTPFVDLTSVGAGGVTAFQVQFNGVTVLEVKSDSGSEQMPPTNIIEMIIPPYTKVNVQVISSSASAGFFATQIFKGKIYE
jgi:hypothetical protein